MQLGRWVDQKQLPIQTRARVTSDTPRIPRASARNFAPREDGTGAWRLFELQRQNLLSYPTSKLIDIVLNLSPQADKGLWDFIRFANPGYVMEVENRNARAVVMAFLERIKQLHGNFDVLLDTMFASFFVSGAVFKELVFDGGQAVNIAVMDPNTARYRRNTKEGIGQYWQLGQQGKNANDFIPLDDNPFVDYIPINRMPERPYGRSVMGPAVYTSVFMLSVLQDLKKVIESSGMQRPDYSVNSEALTALIQELNPEIIGDADAITDFIESHLDQIKVALESLGPDSAYVHLDTVEVNNVQGSVGINMMTGLTELMSILERQIVIGLKSIPILMGIGRESTRGYDKDAIHFLVHAISKVQEAVADSLNDDFRYVLQAAGQPGTATFSFKRQRIVDRKEIAETEKIQLENINTKVAAEYISQDEARMEARSLRDPLEVW